MNQYTYPTIYIIVINRVAVVDNTIIYIIRSLNRRWLSYSFSVIDARMWAIYT